MSVVVRQLKKEREQVQKQLQRIDAALSALGNVSSNGASRNDVSSRSQEDQPGAESALGEGKGSRAEGEENDLTGRPQENRGGSAGAVGEVEARSMTDEPESPGGG
jgi:hypothetical protein